MFKAAVNAKLKRMVSVAGLGNKTSPKVESNGTGLKGTIRLVSSYTGSSFLHAITHRKKHKHKTLPAAFNLLSQSLSTQ